MDCREEFLKKECKECINIIGHCDRNQRLKNEITTCYEEFLEAVVQEKDKVIEAYKKDIIHKNKLICKLQLEAIK